MRVKSRWHNQKRAKSVEEIGKALGFITWRIASNAVNKMYTTGFNFSSNVQQLAVIAEFTAFLIQVADRLVYGELDDDERQRFISTLALHLADTMQDNTVDEMGPGDYKEPYIERLNERLEAYSEFNFVDRSPSYPALRYLGVRVDEVMGGEENKWVIEQVMEVEAPAMLKAFNKAVDDLFEGRKPEVDEA